MEFGHALLFLTTYVYNYGDVGHLVSSNYDIIQLDKTVTRGSECKTKLIIPRMTELE